MNRWRWALIYFAGGEVAQGAAHICRRPGQALGPWSLQTPQTLRQGRELTRQESGPRHAGVSGIWVEARGESIEL